jgi:hypothetical protein
MPKKLKEITLRTYEDCVWIAEPACSRDGTLPSYASCIKKHDK